MDLTKPFYKHYIFELYGVNALQMADLAGIDNVIRVSLPKINIHILKSESHAFTPHGLTLLYLLSESHLSLHTWPEREYVHVDMMTCSDSDINIVLDDLKEYFSPKDSKITELKY